MPAIVRTATIATAVILAVGTVLPARSAPQVEPPTDLGPVSLGGSAVASSVLPGFPANAAFDGQRYGSSKASLFENGWVARSAVGAWVERDFPGPTDLVAAILTPRSDPDLPACTRARRIEVDFGKGQPQTVELPDVGSPTRIALAANAIRSVRFTVRSVWGSGCGSSSVGFSEIELYGTPKSWTPIRVASVSASPSQGTTAGNAEVRFLYDASIPASSQAYLTDLLNHLVPAYRAVLGAPLTDQTLTVTRDPSFGSFVYSWPNQRLVLSRLPVDTLPITDPANWDFNANLAHELAHAWQGPYGFGARPWFREGYAQAAADLAGRVLAEQGAPTIAFATVSAEMATRTYDSFSGMGPETLSGLWNAKARFFPYAVAEGLWTILLSAESPNAGTGRAVDRTFLAAVNGALAQTPNDGSDAAYRAILASVSPNPIDGLPADHWLTRQPITWSADSGIAFGFAAADCLCTDASAAQPQHLFIVDNEFGLPSNGAAIRVTLSEADGTLLVDDSVSFRDAGFGFHYYTFPVEIAALPAGRYTVAVEGSTITGARRSTQTIAVGSRTAGSADGVGLVRPAATTSDPYNPVPSQGTYRPASIGNGVLFGLSAAIPQTVSLTDAATNLPTQVSIPAPYTRFVPIP